MRYFAFNGDADGLFALQQLRLAEPGDVKLVTGVKRDIALLARVPAEAGDSCTVLDISLDVNRTGLVALLDAGVRVRYFDHHFAGAVPEHSALEAHLDPAPDVCTSLLVDRYLEGRYQLWAIAAAFGDNLAVTARGLAARAGLDDADVRALEELGVCVNYNAYGEVVEDLRTPPAELAELLLPFADPREFLPSSAYRVLLEGYREDMTHVGALEPVERAERALLYVLPPAAWARRASGTLANDLAQASADSAVAVLAPRSQGGFVVSVRVPAASPVGADSFCRRFPSGGGRRAAAGINELPAADVATFARAFMEQFQGSS